MEVKIITSATEFGGLHDEWSSLSAEAARDNPFLTHEWLQTWWEVHGHGEPYVITCRDVASAELVGVLPLFRFTVRGLPPATVVRFMGSEQVSSDFLECLARRGREQEVYAACLDAMLADVGAWDLIELQDLEEDAPFCRFLATAGIPGLETVRDPGKCCPYLELPASWEMLLKGLSTKVRQRVGYYRRALERKGEVGFEQVADPAALAGALDDLVRLRRDRLDQKGLSSVRVTDAYRSFHGRIMTRMLASGRLRLYFLRFEGERIAFLYLYAGTGRLFFYQTGFDRSWSNQSVGFVLLGMVIERAIAEGETTFEFLRGAERYKYEWNPSGERQLVDMIIPGNTLAAHSLRIRRGTLSLVRGWVRRVVPEQFRKRLQKALSAREADRRDAVPSA